MSIPPSKCWWRDRFSLDLILLDQHAPSPRPFARCSAIRLRPFRIALGAAIRAVARCATDVMVVFLARTAAFAHIRGRVQTQPPACCILGGCGVTRTRHLYSLAFFYFAQSSALIDAWSVLYSPASCVVSLI